MSRPFALVLLATVSVAVYSENADARCRCGRGGRSGTFTSNSSWSSAAPTMASNNAVMSSQPVVAGNQQATQGISVAQSNSTGNYQSFSYEPNETNGSQAAVTPSQPMVTPSYASPVQSYQNRAMYRTDTYQYNNVIRGDRKVRGHTAQSE